MAGHKTNSNSMTSILIEKLNNEKSGFRYKMIKELNLSYDIRFEDGTHKSIPIKEMQGKEVDIIGFSNKNIEALIEIKVNRHEELQDSQSKGGDYEKTVENHSNIKLFFIIPDKYEHENSISKKATKIYWSKVYEISKKYDTTGLSDQIEYFVENSFDSLKILLKKEDVIMFLSPKIIGSVISLHNKITNCLDNYVGKTDKIIKMTKLKQDKLGYTYSIKGYEKIDFWIGLHSLEKNEKETFFICISLYAEDYDLLQLAPVTENIDYYKYYWPTNNGCEYYFPIKEKNSAIPEFLFEEDYEPQQEKFNILMDYNIRKVLDYLKKDEKL